MIAAFALMMTPGGAATVEPPAAAPTSVDLYYYAGNTIGVQWTNGDTSSGIFTQIGQSTEKTTEPTTSDDEVAAGVTSYETGTNGTISADDGTPLLTRWWVRHRRGPYYTAWVKADGMVKEGEALP